MAEPVRSKGHPEIRELAFGVHCLILKRLAAGLKDGRFLPPSLTPAEIGGIAAAALAASDLGARAWHASYADYAEARGNLWSVASAIVYRCHDLLEAKAPAPAILEELAIASRDAYLILDQVLGGFDRYFGANWSD